MNDVSGVWYRGDHVGVTASLLARHGVCRVMSHRVDGKMDDTEPKPCVLWRGCCGLGRFGRHRDGRMSHVWTMTRGEGWVGGLLIFAYGGKVTYVKVEG